MNILKSPFQARLALASSLFSMSVMLAACGGGAQEEETNRAMAQEAAASLALAAPDSAAEGDDAVIRPPLADWETADDPVLAADFLARQQAQGAATERALASAALVADTRTKWNPGHYVALGRRDQDTILKALEEIKPYPQVKGLILRYEWAQLESGKGVYDFSRIDRDLAMAQAAGKRLWVMVATKVFTAGGRAVPDYLHTAEYEGGAYKIVIGARDALGSTERLGENAALHNAKVRDRLIALTTAMGARYNKHNAFEGITFNETAMGQTLVPLTSAQKLAYFDNLGKVDAATKLAFPNTVVMQFINFPKPYMPGLITSMVNGKVALGGPDILVEDPDLVNNIYPLYDMAKGKVPVGPSVQPENYLTTTQNGAHNPPAISTLYNFGRTRLGANYMFWTRSMTGTPTPWPRVLDFFKSGAFPKDAAGGLTTTCPSTVPSCVARL